jgi:hypothetical protein
MNNISRKLLAIAAGCVLLVSAGEAGAQSSPYRQYNSGSFVNGNLKQAFQKQWKGTAGGPQSDATVAPEKLPLSVSSFRPVSAPVMHKRVVASLQDLDEEQRQELEGALLELLKGYDQLLEDNDEQRLKNNLAGAFNFLFMTSYYALKNGQELTEAQQESMLEQVNAAIAMGLKERRMSDREKQEMYESVVLSGTLILGLYNEGRDKGRPEQMKTARELAKDLLGQMMGITLDRVHVVGDTVSID